MTLLYIEFIFICTLLRANGFHYVRNRPLFSTALPAFSKFLSLVPNFSKSNPSSANRDNLKSELIRIASGTENGLKASNDVKLKVNELVQSLEKLNPTSKITTSKLLDGKWTLLYTTNEGSSAGKLGPFIGAVTQDIRFNDKFYENKVSLFNDIVVAALGATWDVAGPNLWTVKFLDIQFSLFGNAVSKKSLQGTVGTWRTTYLDENIRILYAIGGKNTVKENIYILTK